MADKETQQPSAPVPASDTDDGTLHNRGGAVESGSGGVAAAAAARTKETDVVQAGRRGRRSYNDNNDDDDDDDDGIAIETVDTVDAADAADAADAEKGDTNALTPVASFSAVDVPDGGWEAWLVVFGAFCTAFCSFGWVNSIGIFQEYYESGPLAQYSSSTISWIPSLQIFFILATGPIVGRLFDRYGPRRLVVAGTVLDVFGLMMASISKEYYQFLLSQGVCSSIGLAAVYQPSLACVPGWFRKRRGLAYGVLSSGSSLGGVVFPIMVSRLIRSIGYGWAMRSCALMMLALLVVAVLTVRSRFHEMRAAAAAAAQQAGRGSGSPGGGSSAGRGPGMTRKQALAPLRDGGFVLLLLGMLLLTFGIFVPIDYLPVSALATGHVDKSLAPYLVSILNALSLFGRLGSGWLADRCGQFNTFLLSTLAAGVVTLALWIPGASQGATVAFAALFGFFSGAYISLVASLVAQVSPHKEIGYRTGLVFLGNSIPGLVTSPIAGAILTAHGSSSGGGGDPWVGVKAFAGAFILAGTAVIMLSRAKYAGWNPLTVF